jgi:hypothetical protein
MAFNKYILQGPGVWKGDFRLSFCEGQYLVYMFDQPPSTNNQPWFSNPEIYQAQQRLPTPNGADREEWARTRCWEQGGRCFRLPCLAMKAQWLSSDQTSCCLYNYILLCHYIYIYYIIYIYISIYNITILGSYSTLLVYSLGDILMNEVLFCTGQRSVPRAISCSVVNGTEPRNAAVELDRPLMVVRFLWNHRSQQQKHALKYLEIRISNGNTPSQCQ